MHASREMTTAERITRLERAVAQLAERTGHYRARGDDELSAIVREQGSKELDASSQPTRSEED